MTDGQVFNVGEWSTEVETAKLRFVERQVPAGEGLVRTVRILQQAWQVIDYKGGVAQQERIEWRDVPLATETDDG